jgi:hypothetical protein
MQINENVVRGIIVLMLIFPILWDWVVWLLGHPDMTITAVFQRWSKESALLPFALGALTAHLVWFAMEGPNGAHGPR